MPPRSLAIVAAIIAVRADRRLSALAQHARRRAGLDPGRRGARRAPAPAAPRRAAARAPQAAAGQPVTLTATGEVWLRITDGAGGPTLFMGSLDRRPDLPGPGRPPGSPVIRTGRPQMLRASVGGRDLGPLEPAERTIDNVSLPRPRTSPPAPSAPAAGRRAAPPAAPPSAQ